MKILLIDQLGASLDFCLQCQNVGHDVRLYVAPAEGTKKPNPLGNGLVKKVQDWKPSMQWADLIVLTDNSSLLEELEPYQKKNYPIFGCNMAGAALELDRQKGQDVFRKAGIKVMDSTEFNDYDKAIAHVEKSMKRFVSKPNGDVDKALSYVSKSPKDMRFMLERWKDKNPQNQGFILQEFQPGIEMAVGGWFGKHGWSQWFLENFEHKKLRSGDSGVNTGEEGTVMRYVKDSKLADKLLKPLTTYLHSINYRGYFDMAAIIADDSTPWPLEATARPGWPCFIIQTALHLGDPAQWMLDLLHGEDTLEVMDEIATGVVVTIPDYPFTTYTGRDVKGFPVYHDDMSVLDDPDIHLCEVEMGEAPQERGGKLVTEQMPVTCGDYVLVATGTDFSVEGSARRAYRAIKKIEIPNSPGYRDDIGERLKKQLPDLQDMGYAEGWAY